MTNAKPKIGYVGVGLMVQQQLDERIVTTVYVYVA